jgi:hypothetical protein
MVKRRRGQETWPGLELYRGPASSVMYQLSQEDPPSQAGALSAGRRRRPGLSGSTPPLSEVWEHAQANLKALPEPYKALIGAPAYPLEFSPGLRALRAEAGRRAHQPAPATTTSLLSAAAPVNPTGPPGAGQPTLPAENGGESAAPSEPSAVPRATPG